MQRIPENEIEQIIGEPRDSFYHWGYADSEEQKISIMHSAHCLALHKRGVQDMFDCAYSIALDRYGIGLMPENKSVVLRITGGKLAERDAGYEVDEDIDIAMAWSDYRKDYGINEKDMIAVHRGFVAGWKAAKEGPQDGVLR